jgi:hypothetical protein
MSSQPAATRASTTPLHRGLPEEITVWEILVRLPPKALLRCRAACRAWRRATSDRDFLLAHHGRQPSLPIVLLDYGYDGRKYHLNFLTFDHRVAEAQLQHVLLHDEIFTLDASCDGIFILSTHDRKHYVHNPASRQSARLREIDDFRVLGMYQHRPTGEYRRNRLSPRYINIATTPIQLFEHKKMLGQQQKNMPKKKRNGNKGEATQQ